MIGEKRPRTTEENEKNLCPLSKRARLQPSNLRSAWIAVAVATQSDSNHNRQERKSLGEVGVRRAVAEGDDTVSHQLHANREEDESEPPFESISTTTSPRKHFVSGGNSARPKSSDASVSDHDTFGQNWELPRVRRRGHRSVSSSILSDCHSFVALMLVLGLVCAALGICINTINYHQRRKIPRRAIRWSPRGLSDLDASMWVISSALRDTTDELKLMQEEIKHVSQNSVRQMELQRVQLQATESFLQVRNALLRSLQLEASKLERGLSEAGSESIVVSREAETWAVQRSAERQQLSRTESNLKRCRNDLFKVSMEAALAEDMLSRSKDEQAIVLLAKERAESDMMAAITEMEKTRSDLADAIWLKKDWGAELERAQHRISVLEKELEVLEASATEAVNFIAAATIRTQVEQATDMVNNMLGTIIKQRL